MSKTLTLRFLAGLMSMIVALSSSQVSAQSKGYLQKKPGESVQPVEILQTKAPGSKTAQPNKSSQKPGWALTFSDEFDSLDGLEAPQNPSWWWSTRYPWGPMLNNELEYYTSYSENPNPKCNPGGANHLLNSAQGLGSLQLVAKRG